MEVLWVLLAVLYIVMVVWLGLTTLRRGHVVLFILGFFIPILWIVGAFVAGPNDARIPPPADRPAAP
jgi:hypothetical protein